MIASFFKKNNNNFNVYWFDGCWFGHCQGKDIYSPKVI